jgi:hypothetical protein
MKTNRDVFALVMVLMTVAWCMAQARSCFIEGPVRLECLKRNSAHECFRTHLP